MTEKDTNLFSIINDFDKKYKFLISKSVKTKSEINPRTVEISEMFGVGIDEEKEFEIFSNFSLGFNDGEVIYITGDSGSGKSILLKEIKNKLQLDSYISEEQLEIDENVTIINGLDKDLNETIKILSIVGLNDAFIFLRKKLIDMITENPGYNIKKIKST